MLNSSNWIRCIDFLKPLEGLLHWQCIYLHPSLHFTRLFALPECSHWDMLWTLLPLDVVRRHVVRTTLFQGYPSLKHWPWSLLSKSWASYAQNSTPTSCVNVLVNIFQTAAVFPAKCIWQSNIVGYKHIVVNRVATMGLKGGSAKFVSPL